jgi:hypothetical protein
MSEVHAGLGINTPETVRDAVTRWRGSNPKNARGSNPYSLQQFSIDPDEAAALYKDYMQYFDIPREQDGVRRAGN